MKEELRVRTASQQCWKRFPSDSFGHFSRIAERVVQHCSTWRELWCQFKAVRLTRCECRKECSGIHIWDGPMLVPTPALLPITVCLMRRRRVVKRLQRPTVDCGKSAPTASDVHSSCENSQSEVAYQHFSQSCASSTENLTSQHRVAGSNNPRREEAEVARQTWKRR